MEKIAEMEVEETVEMLVLEKCNNIIIEVMEREKGGGS